MQRLSRAMMTWPMVAAANPSPPDIARNHGPCKNHDSAGLVTSITPSLTRHCPRHSASGSNGSAGHLACELFKLQTGAPIIHVPYKGGGPAMTDLLGGQVQMMFDNMASSLPQIKAGKLKAFAVTTPKRSALAPDLPTMAEVGVKDFDVFTWWGLFAPADTPSELVKRLSIEVNKSLAAPDLREKWLASGAEPAASTPEEFKAFIGKELTKYARIVKEIGAKVD